MTREHWEQLSPGMRRAITREFEKYRVDEPADTLDTVLRLCDEGATVDAMREATGLKSSRVYAILRKHRPNRPRQPRRRTSDIPPKVLHLAASGISPRRVAFLLEITPQYVYQILNECEQ